MSKRIDSVDLLVEPFRSTVKLIIEDLTRAGSKLRVFETRRSLDRQSEIFRQGFSKTMKSKHLEGKACDFVVFDEGKWSWDSKKYKSEYALLGNLVKQYKGIRWGGLFKKIVDLPHIEAV